MSEDDRDSDADALANQLGALGWDSSKENAWQFLTRYVIEGTITHAEMLMDNPRECDCEHCVSGFTGRIIKMMEEHGRPSWRMEDKP